MSDRLAICDLDLLAYADDPLGLEPRRRQAVEEHLRGHADAAALVEAFRRQNLALRQRYDRYAHAPVPERLYDALEAQPAGGGGRLMRRAAAAGLVAAAALAGWMAGDRYGGPALDSLEAAAPPAARQAARPAPWAREAQAPVAVAGLLEYGAGLPELGHLGFSLLEAEPASRAASGTAQLTYGSEDGRRFTLLLGSRWQDRSPGFRVEKRGDLSVVSWEEGRLAAELTSRVGRQEALEIAEAVRASLGSAAPTEAAPAEGRLAAGSAEPATPADAGGLAPPQQLR